MNDNEAIRLLNETFNSEFNLGKFTNFLNELFNGFYPQPKSIGIHKEYEQHISSINKLGNYNLGNKSMEIMVVKLRKGTSLDRARTMQRNVIAKLLKNFNIDTSLVAFTSEDTSDWRFSFVKMDYKLAQDGKVSEELTPAKRYSFLVGPNEPNHTCRSQFIELIKTEVRKPSIDEIENAFSIEKVTKEFFEKYKSLYHSLKDNLDKLVKKDKNLLEEFENKQISTIDFSKKLLGQIVFLYFLQKKGWLGVRRGEKGKFEQWGYGSRRFVQELFYKSQKEKKNFFNNYLEPLFYHALATDRRADEDYYEKFDCKIPFLNGGLFEPLNGYNWGETDINLDNALFEEIFKTFDEFNFTIKEDEPLEKEVAVDPEMLGKVFENLLDVEDRKSKGAFYTPREIVHYMCQQSLINYLETNINILREDLEFFIQKGDLALEYIRRLDFGKYVDKEFILPTTISKNAKEIDNLLRNIKICDPAVGSGAFPVGMMNEIIKARTILSYILKQPKTDYELKRETIENSLYGVDIEPSAVEITKLRFWLSLIVDEEDMTNIKPLPNLENKIMCGNSLIEEFEGIKLYVDPNEIRETKDKQVTLDQTIEKKVKKSEQKLKELRQKQKEFFDVENRTQKNKLKEEIDKIEWEFIEETLREQGDGENMKKLEQYKKNKSKPFFLWKLYFSDVFHRDNPGFDVVIANPPYVFTREADFSVDFKEYVSKNYLKAEESVSKSHARQSGKINLYSLFIIRGIQLLKKSGSMAFITPNNLLRTTTYDIVRKSILDNCKILQIIDLGSGIFHNVTASTIVTIFQRETKEEERDMTNIKIINQIRDLSKLDFKEKLIEQKEFKSNTSYTFNISLNPSIRYLFLKLEKNSVGLGEVVTIHAGGIATGPNKKEMISDSKKNEMFKPLIEGKDVKPYYPFFSNKYINYDRKKLYRPRDENIFLKKEKLITQRIGGGNRVLIVSYDDNQYYTFNSTNILLMKNVNYPIKYILALLNSRLLNWYYVNKFTNQSTLTVNISKTFLEIIPIKKISKSEQEPFIDIVNKILEITKDQDYLENSQKQAKVKAYEKKIDQLVYDLYELTPEEIKIVEEFEDENRR